jgi:hypothetical protein
VGRRKAISAYGAQLSTNTNKERIIFTVYRTIVNVEEET